MCLLQASEADPVKAAATAEALSALLVLLVPPGGSPQDAPPPPGDLLSEPCLAGTTTSFLAEGSVCLCNVTVFCSVQSVALYA